jgi:hypothetical protein
MPVGRLNSGSVKDEDDQREPNYTRCRGARVSEYVFESVGHLIVAMLEFGDSLGILV